jgi:N,N'-diacetyllegionaminate synthase
MAVEIIAEVANAHQGDPEQAFRIAEAGLAGGADAIKFQVYFGDELLVRSHPRYDHFCRQSFAPKVWPDLIGAARQKAAATGARIYCDAFGVRAFETAAAAGVDGFKVHTSDLGNVPLLEALRATDFPVFLSTGGSTAREIASAVRTLRRQGRPRPILMHGYQSFPTPLADSCLTRLAWLRQHFGMECEIGYQDHVDASDPFSIHLPLMALAAGASTIEKHVTLDRGARGVDYYSSLEPAEFAAFVTTLRRAETALGGDPSAFAESERAYRRAMKKFWVTTTTLPAGHILGEADLVPKRAAEDRADTIEREKLLGHMLVRDITKDAPLTRAYISQKVWAAVVARMASRRLPGKALMDVGGMPALAHLFTRLKQAKTLEGVVFCTTAEPEDDPLVAVARDAGIPYYRGPTKDVLGRILGAFKGRAVDIVVRVTGDDILIDPDYLDRAVHHHLAVNAEYSNLHALPSGTEVEVFDFRLLCDIHRACRTPDDTEYLTLYVTRHPDQIRTSEVPVDARHRRDWRLTIDTPEDYRAVSRLLAAMQKKGRALTYRLDDIVDYFEAEPDAMTINARKEKRTLSVNVDTMIDWSRIL